MILTRTPLRIPLGGGGTDLPGFYKENGGFFITATINCYIYVAINYRPIKGIRLGYSKIEEVSNISNIIHPITKATLAYLKIPSKKGIEIVSIGDLPSGAGLGSSGSFTVGLINSLQHIIKDPLNPYLLAKKACHINMEMLKEPSGPQDEFASSYGGFMCFDVEKNGNVKPYPLKITEKTKTELQNNLLMFYTGVTRKSSKALTIQEKKLRENDIEIYNNLKQIKEIGHEIKKALESGKTDRFGELLNNHWEIKRKRSHTTNSLFNRWYHIAIENGAKGGKIMGAGGGGFFIFYCRNEKEKLRKVLLKEGLEEVKFQFETEGSKVLVNI